MPTRNVVLTEYQAELIERLVSSGRYQNASEVLREGLRLVERLEEEDRVRLRTLRQAARVGLDAIEGGQYRTFTGASALHAHLQKVTSNALSRTKKRAR